MFVGTDALTDTRGGITQVRQARLA